ncbi:hypothetical protein CL689_06310 [Candidatus Saccharibacteria bacterium]|nr:hypothetical protein [Candidatus Saccharibacteria bacterium]|tara:strand:+ start:2328 stop:3065 length:738 start_codon:yes stop_codon:yes gene_type:complete
MTQNDRDSSRTVGGWLAKDHTGMKLDLAHALSIARQALPKKESLLAYTLEELNGHITEMANRFYSGDITVVDEFFQLYNVGVGLRKTAKEQAVLISESKAAGPRRLRQRMGSLDIWEFEGSGSKVQIEVDAATVEIKRGEEGIEVNILAGQGEKAVAVTGIQALNLDLLLGMAKHAGVLDLIKFAERHGVIIEDHPKNRTMRCWREVGKETGQTENQAYEDIRSAFLGALVVLEENLRAKGGATP